MTCFNSHGTSEFHVDDLILHREKLMARGYCLKSGDRLEERKALRVIS